MTLFIKCIKVLYKSLAKLSDIKLVRICVAIKHIIIIFTNYEFMLN